MPSIECPNCHTAVEIAPPAVVVQRLSDDFMVLVLTTGYAVLIGFVWLTVGKPLGS